MHGATNTTTSADLRSPAAEASNLRRQIREIQNNIRESLRDGNGNRPELARQVTNLVAEIVARFGEDQVGYENWLATCTAVGIKSPNPISKTPTRWTTRCPDCGRIVNVHMPRRNILPRIGRH